MLILRLWTKIILFKLIYTFDAFPKSQQGFRWKLTSQLKSTWNPEDGERSTPLGKGAAPAWFPVSGFSDRFGAARATATWCRHQDKHGAEERIQKRRDFVRSDCKTLSRITHQLNADGSCLWTPRLELLKSEKTWQRLNNPGLGRGSSDTACARQAGQLDVVKIRDVCSLKGIERYTRKEVTDERKILTGHMSGEGLVPREDRCTKIHNSFACSSPPTETTQCGTGEMGNLWSVHSVEGQMWDDLSFDCRDGFTRVYICENQSNCTVSIYTVIIWQFYLDSVA